MTDAIIARFNVTYSSFSLNVDLRLPSSGITVLFGQSGSGKTTLLRCIAGLQHAPHGFLAINGTVWQDSDTQLFLPTHQRALGYVFQEANLFAHLNVFDNICYGLKRCGQRPNSPQFQQIVALLDIEHLMKRLPERLSGGEKQRVAIARALVLNPMLLLMDEPLAALDFQRKQEILPFLRQLHRELNIPVLYVTHSRQELYAFADYVVLLGKGRDRASGVLAEVLGRLNLPLAQDQQASSVWHVTVVAQEPAYHLTRVAFTGGELNVPVIESAIGSMVRVQIYARDVSITLDIATATSILNILPATISALLDDTRGQCVVRLMVGDEVLLAHITHKSAVLLKLTVGMSVYVQIKGTSVVN